MDKTELIFMWVPEGILLAAALGAFVYGVRRFFKKGVPLCLQSITMAMGCHGLGSLFHLCYVLTNGAPAEGFTPAYLGHVGFFLFFITASYAHMDRIVDDRSAALRASRRIAFAAPAAAVLLLIPNLLSAGLTPGMKGLTAVIWILGAVSVYFSMKHAIIPDLDFGFVKAIKPYNLVALCLAFAELLFLTARNFGSGAGKTAAAAVFALCGMVMMVAAERGVKKWTI